jgi:hypothetical protein
MTSSVRMHTEEVIARRDAAMGRYAPVAFAHTNDAARARALNQGRLQLGS